MSWVKSLLAANDATADSVIVAGLMAMIALIAYSGYDLIWLHHEWNPTSFALAAGGVIAALAGGKRLRDGLGQQGGQ